MPTPIRPPICLKLRTPSAPRPATDKLQAIAAYAKVVANGSFTGAAKQLGLTRSAVSKAVMELEQLLGVRLLDRTTRHVSPTEAGLAYYERCLGVLAAIEESELEVTRLHQEPRGVLRVNAPMSFGTRYLGDVIAAFMLRYPELRVELSLDDRFLDPLEAGFDVTVRIGVLEDSSLVARRIAPARRHLVASPAYLEAHGTPVAPADLARHRCLHYGHSTSAQVWQLRSDGSTLQVPIRAYLCSNNADVLRAAAVGGIGIAKLPTFIAGPDIRAGRLRAVMCDYPAVDLAIYALYAQHRFLAAKTRAFVDFLVERFGDEPAWDEPASPQKELPRASPTG